jgi:chromosome segregation ATPase
MRNKNWFDRLFNPYDFAYAYAEVDDFHEKEEEEVDLAKTFFEWRIGRFFRNVVRTVTKPIRDITGQTRRENEARREAEKEIAQARASQAEFDKVTKETEANIASRKSAYETQRKEGEAQVSSARGAQTAAAEAASKAQIEGKRNVAYATKQTQATKSRLQSEKIAKATKDAAAAKKALQNQKTAKAPGVSGTVVKAIGGLGGTGKTGSAKGKTKGVKDKPGKLLIG